jgi:hypothetical protein
MSEQVERKERSWPRVLWWAAGGLVVGLVLVALTRWAGLCNDQAQVIILAITAGVGAGYAAVTWEMARATKLMAEQQREANVTAEKTRGDAQSSHVYVWLEDWSNTEDPARLTLVVENHGPGIAEDLMLFPLLRQKWDADAPRRLMADEVAVLTEDLKQEDLKNRLWYHPALRPGGKAYCIAFGLDREDSVVSLVWWDGWRGHQWRCFRIAIEEQDIDEGIRLVRIHGPHGGRRNPCDEVCPVPTRLTDRGGNCPHVWAKTNFQAYKRAMRDADLRADW